MKPDALARDAYRFVHRITTRWGDNDAYGHVNNALYYSFFDTTITAYLIEARAMERLDDGPMIFVAASDCAYFAAFAFPEPVEAGLRVIRVGRTSVTWGLGLFGAGETAPRAQGRFTHVCVDRTSRAPTPWPSDWLSAFERLA